MSFDQLQASLADRYRIERELGKGGMATVYLAEDLKHRRKVAVKVLRPELAAALGPERFLREIETTASLRHPNILPLFDSGAVEGPAGAGPFLYYVMPYIEGESLRDRLAHERQLPLDEALRLAGEVADALGYAHEKGIIHRDIKPENILLERGHAVVADFGIARAATRAGGEKLTETGLAIGTPTYMSPEQSVGESDLDARSDLYALASVLFEMLAGEPPYQGASAQAIIAKRFRDPVPRVSTLRETAPHEVEAALLRALAKSPADRFATAAEFTAALRARAEPAAAAPSLIGEFWIAVLPFKHGTAGADLIALSEGLTEEIIAGLSRFTYLRVIARSSTLQFSGEAVDVRAVGTGLGARYVLEGSLRLAGTTLRLSVQLVDTQSGTHIWADTYDRTFQPDQIFALQDDLAPRIISSIADAHGVLPHTLSESLRSKDPLQLTPYEAVLRTFGYGYRMTPEEHATVRAALERAVEQAPGYADAWGMLSLVYGEEYSNGFNVRPDALGRALQAARRAADAAPSSAVSYNALARALFFRKEFPAFRIAAERALELNPFNGPTVANLGAMLAYAGDWERGCALVERAAKLNPRHPGTYWFAPFYNAYRQGDYRGAVTLGLKFNLPDFFAAHAAMAAAYGQLGEHEAAARSLRELLRLKPDYASTAREDFGKWFDPETARHALDGLRKAGLALDAPPISATPGAQPAPTPSVAVLPFANMSTDPEDEIFADGITEEIINALAQLPGLKVAARTSCFVFKGKHEDLRVVAEKLGVSNVLEGSVRKSGARVRITAQLIAAADGYHLWSERYDRAMDDVFAVQDEVAAAIAGRLSLSLAPAAPARTQPASVEAYELLLKGRVLLNRRGRSIIEARSYLERAVELDPGSAEAHGLLGDCYRLHGVYGIAPPAEMVPRARAEAERALAIDPEHVEALATLSNIAAVHEWDTSKYVSYINRALERDPSHIRARSEKALWLSIMDRASTPIESALAELDIAARLDPLNAWVFAMRGIAFLFDERPAEALAEVEKGLAIDETQFTVRWILVASLSALGRHHDALAAAEPALTMSGRNPWLLAEVAAVHASRGDRAAAEALHQELGERAKTGYVGWSEQAACAASAGHLPEAREMAGKALAGREAYALFWKLPAWGPLRADAEGYAILRSTGL